MVSAPLKTWIEFFVTLTQLIKFPPDTSPHLPLLHSLVLEESFDVQPPFLVYSFHYQL